MEFKIKKNIFLEEISKASKIINIKAQNPALAGILIEVKEDKIIIISSNGMLSFKSELSTSNSNLQVVQEGTFLVKPKYLVDMLRRFDDVDITINLVERNEINIVTNKSEFNLAVLNYEEYPLIGFREKGIEVEISNKEFKNALSQVQTSISETSKKIALNGLNLKIQDNKMTFLGSDMYRISKKEVTLNETIDKPIDIIIPYKTLLEIPKILNEEKKSRLIICEEYLTFITEKVIFQSNLIDAKFPDVSLAFSDNYKFKLTFKTKSILKVLNRFDFQNTERLNFSTVINLQIVNDSIYIKSNISDTAKYEEVFEDFEIDGEANVNISFNTKFLIDAIRSYASDLIEIKFSESSKPIIIIDKGKENLKQIILPTFTK